MTLLRRGKNLTGGPFDRLASVTHCGQAGWGTTGPAGCTCGGCQHWRGNPTKDREARCAEFTRRQHAQGALVPREAFACSAFQRRGP